MLRIRLLAYCVSLLRFIQVNGELINFIMLSFYTVQEQALGYTTSGAKCAIGCFDCTNMNSCNVCSIYYFLFTLPQDDLTLGLNAGDQICLSCPFQSYNDTHAIYCGDCIENQDTWELPRICSYDYIIKYENANIGAYQQIFKSQSQLFFVQPIQFDKILQNGHGIAPYETQICSGCLSFCPVQTINCKPVSSEYTFDATKNFVSCAVGFVYNIAIDGCDSCPENCNTCTMTVETQSEEDEIVFATIVQPFQINKKQCLNCNNGFSLFTGYSKRQNSTDPIDMNIQTRCEPCFQGCNTCYFGSDIINLNLSPDTWSVYVKQMTYTDLWSTVTSKLKLQSIEQRCTVCASTYSDFRIPSLDMTQCQVCADYCGKCEYTSYLPKYVGLLSRFPTYYLIPIINPQLSSDYILKCRRCQNNTYSFNYQGLVCDENTIGNCSIAYYDLLNQDGSSTSTTMDLDFVPSLQGQMKCGLCQQNYQLTYDRKTCKYIDPLVNQAQLNCIIYETDSTGKQLCSQCNAGYSLAKTGVCQVGCAFVIDDFFCSSCYSFSYTDKNNHVPVKKINCLKCIYGYYPNILTGKCSACSKDPAVLQCGACQQTSLYLIYTDYIYVRRPIFTDAQIQHLKNSDEIEPQVICNKCATSDITLNLNSGYCESCQSNCASCNYNAPTAFCEICTDEIGSRSVSLSGDDCLQCPVDCIGCRVRTDQEKSLYSKFFTTENAGLQYFSNICYQCSNTISPDSITSNSSVLTKTLVFNSILGRCISCDSPTGCYLSATIEVYMYCLSGTQQKVNSLNPLAYLYSDLPSYYLSRSQLNANISFQSFENNDIYRIYNNQGVDRITLNINIIQSSGKQINNECVMSKDTYITTGIMRNVFSINDMNLNIKVVNESLQPVLGQSNITIFIFRNLYIEYFNHVSIFGLQISPSIDYNYKYPNAQNPDLRKNPFGIIMTHNVQATMSLKGIHICQTQAMQVYYNQTQYGGPSDPAQIKLKKYNPFFLDLLNIYQLILTDVKFTSFSYLVDKEVKFNGSPFMFSYDSPQIGANFSFSNVTFEDFAVEGRYIFLLQPMTFTGSDPSIVQNINIDVMLFQDNYFINQAGVFGQHPGKTESCGIIFVNRLLEQNSHHNSSNGLINLQTAQKIIVKQSIFIKNFVNNTYQFYVNTLVLDDVEVQDSTYTSLGRFVHTQEKALQYQPGKADVSGITFTLNRVRFSNITCLSENCLVHAQTPINIYRLLMNVTISQIQIANTNSSGFSSDLIDSANSAMIFISNINIVTINTFLSVNNRNLTILNINDVQYIGINKYTCLSSQEIKKQNSTVVQHKDNMCLYVSNFYKTVTIDQVRLQYLQGIDNSFIVFSSWDILVYNTTQPGTRERILISDLQVLSCTIITQEISSVSSSVFIESKQMQYVEIAQSSFFHNTQIQLIGATLTPSNPTVLTQSIVGEISIHDSTWRDNKAGGVGATLYIQMGTGNLTNLIMVGSNWDRQDGAFQANNVSYGGHLFLQGYNLTIQNCTFQNASAVRGTGVYIQSVADGFLTIGNTQFIDLLTPLNPAAESRGGCLYIDSSNSKLQMLMINVKMTNCAVRGDGGCIYMDPSSQSHNVTIYNSAFLNCFSLSGSVLKVTFDKRTVHKQLVNIQNSQITQNYENYVDFMSQLNDQNQPNGLNAIEQYLYIQRSSVIEQDSGYMVVGNLDVSQVYFQSLISLFQVRSVYLENVNVDDSIIIYRPLIEIINPFLNPTVMSGMTFLNITSYTPEKINCSASNNSYIDQQLYKINLFKCNLMQVKIEYPDQLVTPAIIFVNSVTLKAPLQLSAISIDSVVCKECFGGLISIISVYNGDPLKEMVAIEDFTCQNSYSSYYGCLFASSQSIVENSPDDSFLNITYASSYQITNLQNTISKGARLSQNLKNKLTKKFAETLTSDETLQDQDTTANMVVANDYSNDEAYIPSNPYAAHIRVQNYMVKRVNSTYGAGIGIRGLTANITNLYSYQCSSVASGGTVFFWAHPKVGGKVAQRLNLFQNSYTEGQASIGGAIRTIESGTSQINNSQVSFFANKATFYGDDVATYPTKIALVINGTNQKQLVLNSNTEWVAYPITIMSGQALNIYQEQQIIFALLDDDSKTVNYQLQTFADFSTIPSTHLSGSGERHFTTDVQGFDFSNLVVNFNPYVYKTLEIRLTSNAIFIPRYVDYPPYFMKKYDQNYTLQGRMRAVECKLGESYEQNSGTCSPCGPGTYVLIPKSVCLTMDSTKMNETYLDQISILYGQWRSESTVDTTEFCKNQPQNCLGGWNVGNDLCTVGNIGALCEACDWYGVQWGESYSSANKLSCIKCSDAKNNAILIGLLSVFTLFSIITSIKGTKEQMETQCLTDICIKIGWSSQIKATGNKATMIKMLTNYQQIVGFIAQFQLTIPSSVVTVSSTVGSPTSALGHSMECILLSFTPGIDILYWKIIWSLIMNILYVTTILLLMFIGHKLKKLEFKAQYVQTMLLYMFIYLHPNYVQDFILLVSQRNISDHSWVQSNVSYRYDSWSHQKWMYGLGWPGLFFWGILLPFSFLYVVWNGAKTNKLQNIFFRNSWGFFYNEYREGCYYWEFVKIFQKQLMIIVLTFYTDDVIVKGILIFIIIFLYSRATLGNRPYTFNTLNRIDIWSTNCCGLTIIIAVLIYRAIQNNMTYIIYIGYIALGLLNAFFYFCILYFLFSTYLVLLREKLDKVRDKIVEKKPQLMDNPKYRPYLVNQTKLGIISKKKWKNLATIVNSAMDRYKNKVDIRIHFLKNEDENQIKIQEEKLLIEKESTIVISEPLAMFEPIVMSEHIRQDMVDLEIRLGNESEIEHKRQVSFSQNEYQVYDECREKDIQKHE